MTDLTQQRAERAAAAKALAYWVANPSENVVISSRVAAWLDREYPLPRPPVEVREEPDPAPSLAGNSWRFVDGYIGRRCGGGMSCGFDGGWLSEPYCRERLALFVSLHDHPFRCTGCHAPLATESEEHVCP